VAQLFARSIEEELKLVLSHDARTREAGPLLLVLGRGPTYLTMPRPTSCPPRENEIFRSANTGNLFLLNNRKLTTRQQGTPTGPAHRTTMRAS
jgi:hypothetical protein